ncbi:MAG: sulfite exporter TauE/SafE family protein [Cyclobacteriaceae bacterium]|nr:sulfite exporter TauE/SafE family protein [Cyclobacteriaceae bacterium]
MIWTALAIGFVGSFHCIGMCGPIALALPMSQNSRLHLVSGRVLYNLGRAFTYAGIGLLAGLIGQSLSLAGIQQAVSIVSGVLILIIVLIPSSVSQKLSLLKPAYGFTSLLKRKFRSLLTKKSLRSLFYIGVINGFLPCGLVYLALAGAVAMAGILEGAAYMFLFGLGTIPVMLAVSLAGNFVSQKLRIRINRWIPAIMVVLAVLFILRGLNLGIPYISPELRQPGISDGSVICH